MHCHGRLLRSLTAVIIAVGAGVIAMVGLRPATASPIPETTAPARPETSAPNPTATPMLAASRGLSPTHISDAPNRAQIEPAALRQITEEPQTPLRVILVLSTPKENEANFEGEIGYVSARTQFVASQRARFSQALEALEPVLTEALRHGDLISRHELWLINALALTATPNLVIDLATSPSVDRIYLDQYRRYDLEPLPDTPLPMGIHETPWGLTRIRAPEVWQTLAISGTGAVVAVMDTGVDWMHPELHESYRGNLGRGFYNHTASWYDAVNESVYPYDDFGHGTHVIGTAIGATTGVAPGAKWIGVKVLSHDGYGYDSWILEGFQWLLAPGGDPEMAPDIVNASWSSTQSNRTIFYEAVEALIAADILPVFAVGNEGPDSRTVGSPASNPGVFSVGASDIEEAVAGFSSRGPSPWGETKPAVVAPGVAVVSALPGGGYGTNHGTSMATPHVAGLGALMRSFSPTLSVPTMMRLITDTAHPLTDTLPNNASGWGRVDALDALLALSHPAWLSGEVKDVGGTPLGGARIVAYRDVVTGPPPSLATQSSPDGSYRLALPPGMYTITISLFGYASNTTLRVGMLADGTQELNVALEALPVGSIMGQVSIAGSGASPTSPVTVRVRGTPVEASTDADGAYQLYLPAGSYQLEVRDPGYYVITATASVVAGSTTAHHLTLEPAPKLLLVDEGAWYYGSEIEYWREALNSLSLAYDEIRIKTPDHDTPVSDTLHPYDVVLWSSPQGSPGLVGAGEALKDYLEGGGHLLVSGQDVAYFDAGGPGSWGISSSYLYQQMGVLYLDEIEQISSINGSGPFDGMEITLNGGDGADNQWLPDAVRVASPQHTSPIWRYDDKNTVAGTLSDICVPYRAIFMGFGFEAISNAEQRRTVLARSLDWLEAAPLTAGLRAVRASRSVLVANPGQTVTHVVSVTHIGSAGVTDTVQMVLENIQWPTVLSSDTLILGPCKTLPVSVSVTIPPDTGIHMTAQMTLLISSQAATPTIAMPLATKSPAPVLLVDDDRWYPVEDRYIESLTASGIPFDLWDTQPSSGQALVVTSPPTDTLKLYPIVVWFTGYDWYAPVLPNELSRINAYLDGGGRLLLSSQDFIFHHQDEALTRRLGVLSYDWEAKATHASGVIDHPAGGAWGPVNLDYPFPNWSHTIEPAPEARPVIRGQLGQPVGIAAVDANSGAAQSLFYALPLEALPSRARQTALENGVGWLSPLGKSEWSIAPATLATGEEVTFDLTLNNSSPTSVTADVTHYVPASFALPTTIPNGAILDSNQRTLRWTGQVQPGESVTLTWQAFWIGEGEEKSQAPTVTLGLPAWNLHFEREAPFYGQGPNLSTSQWNVQDNQQVRIGAPVSLTFQLHNQSAIAMESGRVTVWLMRGVSPVTATVPLTHGVESFLWTGKLTPYESMILTLPVRGWEWRNPVRVDALLEDGSAWRWERRLWLTVTPWQTYMPVVYRTH